MRGMSKAVRRGKNEDSVPDALPFEEAIGKLEAIVEEMETDDLALEDLLSRYEHGAQLVAACQKKLEQAELKIQQLEKKASGKLEIKPADIDVSD